MFLSEVKAHSVPGLKTHSAKFHPNNSLEKAASQTPTAYKCISFTRFKVQVIPFRWTSDHIFIPEPRCMDVWSDPNCCSGCYEEEDWGVWIHRMVEVSPKCLEGHHQFRRCQRFTLVIIKPTYGFSRCIEQGYPKCGPGLFVALKWIISGLKAKVVDIDGHF